MDSIGPRRSELAVQTPTTETGLGKERFLTHAPGKRQLRHQLADRVAVNCYCAMLPNLYCRATPSFELDFSSGESFPQMVERTQFVGGLRVHLLRRDPVARSR